MTGTNPPGCTEYLRVSSQYKRRREEHTRKMSMINSGEESIDRSGMRSDGDVSSRISREDLHQCISFET